MQTLTGRILAGNRRSRLLSFKTNIVGLKVGDHVLVDTIFGPQVLVFKEYGNSISTTPERWAIQKIDYKENIDLLERGIEL